MKRLTFVILMAALVALLIPAVAMASGWDDPVAGNSPHGSYTVTTDKCKTCHAVHEAENAGNTLNGEKLLRSSVISACDYCHVSSSFAIQTVYNEVPANYSADTGQEHTLGTSVSVPDSNDPAGQADSSNDYTIATFGCVSCHAVHGASTIGTGTNILKADPLGDGGAATTGTEFCADCHDNNDVTVKDTGAAGTDQVSHYMGAVTSATLAAAASTDCNDCHKGGDGSELNNYPHYTAGLQFLNDNYDGSTWDLDGVCTECHPNAGTSF